MMMNAIAESQRVGGKFRPAFFCFFPVKAVWSVLLLLLVPSLQAENRVALVIGNSAYGENGQLASPVNDARAMASVLEDANFEVTLVQDGTLAVMDKALLEFSNQSKGAEASWFYFAGRGVQVKGKNYFIPVDAQMKKKSQVRYVTLGLGQVLSSMEKAGTGLKVVLLDCCRNNPFVKNWSEPVAPGLSSVDAPEGTLIAFSAPPGKVLPSAAGENSPFIKAMVSAMKPAGDDILEVFHKVRKLFEADTGKEPFWLSQQVKKSFVLVEKGAAPEKKKIPAPTVTNQKPKVLSITSFAPAKNGNSAVPETNVSTKTMTPGNRDGESPVVIYKPGQPDFSKGDYYRNSDVFKSGPFERVPSVSVYIELVKAMQRRLLPKGEDSGWMNSKTQKAIMKLQQDNRIPVTGLVDYRTAEILKLKLPQVAAATSGPPAPVAGNTAPISGAPGTAERKLPLGSNVPGMPGIVYSPWSPGKMIDARGRKPGDAVTDPNTSRKFKLPPDFHPGSKSTVPGRANSSRRGLVPGKYYTGLENKEGDDSAKAKALQLELMQKQRKMMKELLNK